MRVGQNSNSVREILSVFSKHVVFLLILSVLWFVISQSSNYLLFAILSIILVSVITYYLYFSYYIFRLDIFLSFLKYTIWMVGEIYRSTNYLIKLLYRSEKQIEPVYGIINTDDLNQAEKAIFANSITLTPGTITILIKENYIIVHAISIELFEELKEGKLKSKVKNICNNQR